MTPSVPMPRFSSKPADLVRRKLFEVTFESELLRDNTDKLLTDSIVSIDSHEMVFNVNEMNGVIQPIATLLPFISNKDNKFNITVKYHNKAGDVIGTLLYEGVYIECTNFFDELLSYETDKNSFNISLEDLEVIKECSVNFSYKKRFYNGIELPE